jgi:hypothetical protein
MGCENYQRLVAEYSQLMAQMTRGVRSSAAYCPEAADAVNDFLRDGEITHITADHMTEFRSPLSVRYRARNLQQIKRSINECNHRVIRAVRSAEQMSEHSLTEHHFFVIFKYHSQHYVADAFGQATVTPDINEYLQQIIYSSLEVASRNFDVTAADPMEDDIF